MTIDWRPYAGQSKEPRNRLSQHVEHVPGLVMLESIVVMLDSIVVMLLVTSTLILLVRLLAMLLLMVPAMMVVMLMIPGPEPFRHLTCSVVVRRRIRLQGPTNTDGSPVQPTRHVVNSSGGG